MTVSSQANMCFLLPVLTVPVKYRITENEQPLPCQGWKQNVFSQHHMISAMTIQVTVDRLIEDIQKDFSYVFPYLKIEFFRKGTRYKQNKQRTISLPIHQTIGSVFKNNRRGSLNITPSMTVRDLERNCDEQFGVMVQLFRRSGTLWLETSMTDNWTLQQQNDRGSEISSLIENLD